MNYAESDKWKFTDDDDFYSRVPEILAELDISEVLGKHLATDFKCKSGERPTFAPFAVHYGVSLSYARWIPSEGTRYFYARFGKTSCKTGSRRIRFYFHAIVYY